MMGTLASELGARVEQASLHPRIYVDANVPAGVVAHMRERLAWDVYAVVEDDTLRRASDLDHYRTARRLHRTLITLDDDFLDERTFPPGESPGVIVLSAPNEDGLVRLLNKVDRAFFADRGDAPPGRLPLVGRSIQVHPDWEPPGTRRTRRRRHRRRARAATPSA